MQHFVHDAVVLGFLGGEERVHFDVLAHAFERLSGAFDKRVLEPFAHAEHLARLDLDLGGLAEALVDRRLVDQHAGVRQDQALALGARRKQDGRGRRRLAEAHGLHVGLDVVHRVVDRRHRGHRPTRRIDVHHHVAVRVEAFQHEQLRHDVVRRRVVDLHTHEDDAVVEQARVRVLTLVSVRRLLFEFRHDIPVLRTGETLGARYEFRFFRCHAHSLVVFMVSCVETSLSTKPYSSASCAVNQWSYSLSR